MKLLQPFKSAFLSSVKGLGAFFIFLWTNPLSQFVKIVGVYGLILNYIEWLFLGWWPLDLMFILGFGLVYYLVFFEVPLLFRPQQVRYLRTAVKPVTPETTKERGRQTIEEARGKKV
jgi:hydrogenase/urease accessory protein HupE